MKYIESIDLSSGIEVWLQCHSERVSLSFDSAGGDYRVVMTQSEARKLQGLLDGLFTEIEKEELHRLDMINDAQLAEGNV